MTSVRTLVVASLVLFGAASCGGEPELECSEGWTFVENPQQFGDICRPDGLGSVCDTEADNEAECGSDMVCVAEGPGDATGICVPTCAIVEQKGRNGESATCLDMGSGYECTEIANGPDVCFPQD